MGLIPLVIDDIVEELERELRARYQVYPEWVGLNKITQRVADHRVECLERAIELVRVQRNG